MIGWKKTGVGILGMCLVMTTLSVGAEPEKVPATGGAKSGFDIPVWHPDARWELIRMGGCNANGFLDGPTREMPGNSLGVFGPGYQSSEGGRFFFGWYDPARRLAYAAAGSGRGYLDGPISRARFSGWDYNWCIFELESSDSRYFFVTDKRKGVITLRRIDWEAQMVSTIIDSLPAFLGMASGPSNTIYILAGDGSLKVINPDGQKINEYKLDMTKAVSTGFLRKYPLAVDDVHNRLYCAPLPGNGWYLGYWDLKDGSYHGGVPKSEKRRGRNEPGPFEGVDWYDEGNIIQFGPDDPEKRFLYMVRTDTWQAFRLDLEKKMVASLWIEGDGRNGKTPVVSFSETKASGTAMIYGSMRWIPDGSGSFTAGTHSPAQIWCYKRIK